MPPISRAYLVIWAKAGSPLSSRPSVRQPRGTVNWPSVIGSFVIGSLFPILLKSIKYKQITKWMIQCSGYHLSLKVPETRFQGNGRIYPRPVTPRLKPTQSRDSEIWLSCVVFSDRLTGLRTRMHARTHPIFLGKHSFTFKAHRLLLNASSPCPCERGGEREGLSGRRWFLYPLSFLPSVRKDDSFRRKRTDTRQGQLVHQSHDIQ